ncbi:hypothetical protein Ciccas_010746 [Cichlidogyrus casuarinus]|uniref:Uncharacterized protein n=1 Tax=Cichlidogyrus casuarinus TaxID=1844966 RepID=A0ABD2PUE8_9PLAT
MVVSYCNSNGNPNRNAVVAQFVVPDASQLYEQTKCRSDDDNINRAKPEVEMAVACPVAKHHACSLLISFF